MLDTFDYQNKREQKQQEKKPVWFDKADSKVHVDIENRSRLRKLKKEENEKELLGDEYTKRLQEQYLKIQGEHRMFQWAKLKEERSEDEDSDPIGDLLKSNTSVFGKRTEMLRQNHIDFKKLKNAN